MEKQPNGGGKPGEAKEKTEEEVRGELQEIGEEKESGGGTGAGGTGYSNGTGNTHKEINPVDKAIYDRFISENASFIRYVRRLMANAKNSLTSERGHKSIEGRKGTRIRIRGVIEHLRKPSEESKLMWQREGKPGPGKKNLVLEDLLIGIDGSGSMGSVRQLMCKLLALICEGAKDAMIPTSIVISYDGTPHVIREGRQVGQQEKTIRKLLQLDPCGGTDMGRGSISTLSRLRRTGSSKDMSRLLIITDCCTSIRDLETVAQQSKDIGYPACVLGLGTGFRNAEIVKKTMPEAALICYDEHDESEEMLYRYMIKFCEWMSDPKSFSRQPQMLSDFKKTIRVPNSSLLKGIKL